MARTDQLDLQLPEKSAQEVLARIEGEYERDYYAGIIWERLGHARIREWRRASAYHALREAMTHYKRALEVASPGNETPFSDGILVRG